MSEREPVVGIVLAHGALAEGLADAVRAIAGAGEEALLPISNRGRSPQELAGEVRERIGSAPTILFTDLPSGSCSFAARWLLREMPDLVVISGVNLPLLLDFVLHRDLPLETLVPRLLERGRAGIGSTPTTLEGHDDRLVSGR